jgi:hypothetical protein
LCGSDLRAEVGLVALTEDAIVLKALRCIARNNSIANLNISDTLTNTFNNTRGLMTQDAWEKTFRVVTIKSVNICVAESVGNDLNSDFSSLGRSYLNLSDIEGLLRSPGNSGLALDDLSSGR